MHEENRGEQIDMPLVSSDLASKIRLKFDLDVPPSPGRHYDPAHEEWEETREFWGKKWEDISLRTFDESPVCFAYFDGIAFAYFWGCMMFLALRENNFENNALDRFLGGWFCEQCLSKTSPSISPPCPNFNSAMSIASALSEEQIGLIEEFFIYREAQGFTDDKPEISRFLSFLRCDQ